MGDTDTAHVSMDPLRGATALPEVADELPGRRFDTAGNVHLVVGVCMCLTAEVRLQGLFFFSLPPPVSLLRLEIFP